MIKEVNETVTQVNPPFMEKFHGRLKGVLRWEHLDNLWQTLQSSASDDWYIYHIGETPPNTSCSSEQLARFIHEINLLLKRDHEHDYCGIVYTDCTIEPAFIKIYDPNNLGQVCGSSKAPPPLPGWILSKDPPVDLQATMAPTASRQRWWQKIFN